MKVFAQFFLITVLVLLISLVPSPAFSVEKTDAEQQAEELKGLKTPAPILKTKEKIEASQKAVKILPEPTTPKNNKEMTGKATFALALGGGGARGAAHIGVIRVLNRAGIKIDTIVGNSMGSVIGGLYCAGVSLEDIDEMLEDKSFRNSYLSAPISVQILGGVTDKVVHPLRKHYAGIYTGKKYQAFLAKKIPAGKNNFQNLNPAFYAVVTNLVDGQAYSVHSGDLATAIHASSAIFPLLEPVIVGDNVYIDGGIRANLPAYAAKQTGAKIVCAVLVDEPLRKIDPTNFKRLKHIAARVADIVLAVNDEHQLLYADIIINPDVSNIPVISDKPSDVRRAIKAGELAAEKALPALRQLIKEKTKSAHG